MQRRKSSDNFSQQNNAYALSHYTYARKTARSLKHIAQKLRTRRCVSLSEWPKRSTESRARATRDLDSPLPRE